MRLAHRTRLILFECGEAEPGTGGVETAEAAFGTAQLLRRHLAALPEGTTDRNDGRRRGLAQIEHGACCVGKVAGTRARSVQLVLHLVDDRGDLGLDLEADGGEFGLQTHALGTVRGERLVVLTPQGLRLRPHRLDRLAQGRRDDAGQPDQSGLGRIQGVIRALTDLGHRVALGLADLLRRQGSSGEGSFTCRPLGYQEHGSVGLAQGHGEFGPRQRGP